jgi:hypothetical protein
MCSAKFKSFDIYFATNELFSSFVTSFILCFVTLHVGKAPIMWSGAIFRERYLLKSDNSIEILAIDVRFTSKMKISAFSPVIEFLSTQSLNSRELQEQDLLFTRSISTLKRNDFNGHNVLLKTIKHHPKS